MAWRLQSPARGSALLEAGVPAAGCSRPREARLRQATRVSSSAPTLPCRDDVGGRPLLERIPVAPQAPHYLLFLLHRPCRVELGFELLGPGDEVDERVV